MCTVGAGALVAAIGGLASLSMPGAAGEAATAAPQATIIIRPSVLHAGHSESQPPTTAKCKPPFRWPAMSPPKSSRPTTCRLCISMG